MSLFVLVLLGCGNRREVRKQQFLLRGNEALGQQNYREAGRFYEEALALDSCYKEALNNQGIWLYEQKQYASAVLSYDKALACDPGFMDAIVNRASAFYELNELYRALDDLQYVARQLPDSAYLYFSMGLVLTKMRKYEDAVASFDKACALDPDDFEALVNRGTA